LWAVTARVIRGGRSAFAGVLRGGLKARRGSISNLVDFRIRYAELGIRCTRLTTIWCGAFDCGATRKSGREVEDLDGIARRCRRTLHDFGWGRLAADGIGESCGRETEISFSTKLLIDARV